MPNESNQSTSNTVLPMVKPWKIAGPTREDQKLLQKVKPTKMSLFATLFTSFRAVGTRARDLWYTSTYELFLGSDR